jgi:hypothetical protein
MRRILPLLSLAAVVAALGFSSLARGADVYKLSMSPGADAGTNATATVTGGTQYMVRCDNYDVKYVLCPAGVTCNAGANDPTIDPNISTDICGIVGYTQLSVYRLYDGGVPTCRLYTVVPQSRDCSP